MNILEPPHKHHLKPLSEDHPELFHYTTEAGLRGIVATNSFYATYFGHLNDSKEIHELRTPIVLTLTDRLLPLARELRAKGFNYAKMISKLGGNERAAERWARTWANALYQATFENDYSLCCITSFCSHAGDQPYERKNGLLSQWRGYGKDGEFCLVFDTAEMDKLFAVEREANFYVHTDFASAYYPRDDVPPTQNFEELLRLSEGVIQTALLRESEIEVDAVIKPFVNAAATFKHRGFFEEREVRLIAIAANEKADERIRELPGYQKKPLKNIEHAERYGKDRQYISLFGKEAGPLPLKSIIIGPSNAQKENAEIARAIVGNHISIQLSETAYID